MIPRQTALNLAEKIVERLTPLTERIVIAGSLRRGKPTVNDIEVLYIPKIEQRQDPESMFDLKTFNLVDEQLNRWLHENRFSKRPSKNGVFIWGEKNKLALHLSLVPVDFFATTQENWWVSLVVRTGSKETNLRLTTGAQNRGRRLNAYGAGITHLATGEITPATSEEHVFELCGIPYLDPTKR